MQIAEKAEAIRRMNEMNMSRMITDYFDKGIVLESYRSNRVLDAITKMPDESVNKIVKAFEEKNDCMVYHVQVTGSLISLLYVSKDKSEWNYEFRKRKNNCYTCEAYVYNAQEPQFSDLGDIVLKSSMGAVARIA